MKILQTTTPSLVLIFTRASLHIQLLRQYLAKDYDIVEATTPEACLEMLHNVSANFLIFDERLVQDEIEAFLEEVHQINLPKEFAIIMISRNLKKPYLNALKELGVKAFIREPLDEEEIQLVLKQCDQKQQIENKISKIAKQIPKQELDAEIEFKHRYLLNDQATRQIREILQEKQSISILMLEIDQFHQTTFGFEESVSQKILDEIDQKILKQIRQQDVLISLGGGKYMVILPKTSKQVAILIAEEIQNAIESHPFNSNTDVFHLTLSIGIASRHIDELKNTGQSMQQLNRLATLAKGFVIESKHTGGQIIAEGI